MSTVKTSSFFLLAGLFVWARPLPVRAAETKADLVRYDFAEERVVDLSVVKKVTGKHKIGFLSTPKYTEFLEGFIRGMVVDYSENPVEGVLVRVGDPGEENSMFDPTVTNFNGIYRIRFSIPFDDKGRVDIKNKRSTRRIGNRSATAWGTPMSRSRRNRRSIFIMTADPKSWRSPRACARAL
jgi:hypothetical protein